MHCYGYMDEDHAVAAEFAELIADVADLKLAKRYLKTESLSSASRKCLEQLRQHCITRLESLTAKAPSQPTHWAQKINIQCDCEDCERLQIFLHDKHEKVLHFKVRKDRRKHLHRQIDAHKCDLDHTTDRSGSPHARLQKESNQFQTQCETI